MCVSDARGERSRPSPQCDEPEDEEMLDDARILINLKMFNSLNETTQAVFNAIHHPPPSPMVPPVASSLHRIRNVNASDGRSECTPPVVTMVTA